MQKINNKTVHFYYIAAKLACLFKSTKLFNDFFGDLDKRKHTVAILYVAITTQKHIYLLKMMVLVTYFA